jgi:hypothetical protein
MNDIIILLFQVDWAPDCKDLPIWQPWNPGTEISDIDGKGYDHVVMIKVNVKWEAGRDYPDNEESKKEEGDGEQVTESNEVLVHLCF